MSPEVVTFRQCGKGRLRARFSINESRILKSAVIAKAKGCQTADRMTVSARLFVRRSGSFSEGPGRLLWQIVPSGLEGNLRTHRECVELGAGFRGVGRADLFGDVAMQIVEHEADVAIDVPVQRRRIDRLPAAALASLPAQPVPDPLVNVGKCEST